jgi:uncharacterized membrane protein
MELARVASLIAATVTTGLMAGLFCAFSYSVMPGLARTDSRTFVEAMQQINKAILNGWFATCFLGALVFTALAAILHFRNGVVFAWTIVGLALYVATLLITFRFNVPLNDQLAAAGLDNAEAAREQFESDWARWNVIRTITSVLSFGCLLGAFVVQ